MFILILDPLVKCLMAIQIKQGHSSFISEDLAHSRTLFDARMKAIAAKPTTVKVIEGCACLCKVAASCPALSSSSAKKLPMVIFYHGGAFMVGSLDSHDEFCRLLAVHAKVQVLTWLIR